MSDQPQRIGQEVGRASDPTALTTDALQREIAHLTELFRRELEGRDNLNDERFKSIDDRFEDVEIRRSELKVDNQREVSTALTATNAAISKTEMNTKETLTQLSAQFRTEVDNLRRGTDDLKNRVTIVEASKAGGREATTDTRANNAAVYAAVGFGVMLVLAAITFVGVLAAKGGP